jgi:aspartyl-tRNA(Asn)/glutamyl-tRNA(Gln) amidotransferase subunit A
MFSDLSPLKSLRHALATAQTSLPAVAEDVAKSANSNASRNTYLECYTAQAQRRAEQLPIEFPDHNSRPYLYGVPVSIKDCFDVAGSVTSCGSRFYAKHNSPATKNSWVAQRLLDAGAILTGKTHLHQLAYGVTGENADYGDCLQPHNQALLTGGSSSGAAASVQERSALVAIGTDTGGSVRVPAALCGLTGYRSSHGVAQGEKRWAGGYHLSPTFDTIGLLFRDLRDAPALAASIFDIASASQPSAARIGYVGNEFLYDCDLEALETYEVCKQQLVQRGAILTPFNTDFWSDSPSIYSPIVASEAAAIHRGYYQNFEPVISERLASGAAIPADEIQRTRQRLEDFRSKMSLLFQHFDFLIAPAIPVTRLYAGDDHAGSRKAILRYTTPASLAGLPAMMVPGRYFGDMLAGGIQILAAPMQDARLLAFTSTLATS